MPTARLPIFQNFIDDIRALWASETDMAKRAERAKELMEVLVLDPVLQARSREWPSTEGHKNLLLYADRDYGFVINAVVRVPGRTGMIHDHADTWVVYGVLDGSESLERYDRLDDGSRPGYAEIKLASVTIGTPGKVDVVAPYEIHSEKGGPTRSSAIILRSQQLGEGTVMQGRYNPTDNTYYESYGATQVPYELAA